MANTNQRARHPLAAGEAFRSVRAEIKWARGKMSSGDFETQASFHDLRAIGAAKRLNWWRREYAVCLQIAADASHTPELRAEAEGMAGHIAKYKLPDAETNLQIIQQSAANNREMAEQARKFEARWSFNPYVDELLDEMERRNLEYQRQAQRPPAKRKASDTSRTARRAGA
jgi:serine phosphatase RsbU (regulator of sigma subunit)